MKKLLLSAGFLAAFGASAQTTLFSEGFESYNAFTTSFGNWLLADIDQSTTYGFQGTTFTNSSTPFAFIIFDPTQTTPALPGTAWAAKTGTKSAACFASTTPPNNDWMITPPVQLGASGNNVSFWAKSATTQYGKERFRVGISSGGTNPTDFTIMTPGSYVEVDSVWTYYFFQVGANFNNQNVRIGINCVSNDAFGFLVDDFAVKSGVVLGNDEITTSPVLAYPNPAIDVLNISMEGQEITSVSILSLDGKIVTKVQGAVAQVATLSPGMYIYEATTASGTVVRNNFMKK